MPICKTCGKHFPNRCKVNGTVRVINRRKNCFDCKPFKTFNNSNNSNNKTEKECICQICGKKYYYERANTKGHTTQKCGSCSSNLRKDYKKRIAVLYKGGKCNICGYDKYLQCLDFRHVNEKEKKFDISGGHCYSWRTLQNELNKCILVCCRCHREIHLGAYSERYIEDIHKKSENVVLSKLIEEHSPEDYRLYYEDNGTIQYKKSLYIKKCSCGKEFKTSHKRQKFCSVKCKNYFSQKVPRPSKSKLTQDIKKLSWKQIGKKYGVSDNSIRKWAKKYKLI